MRVSCQMGKFHGMIARIGPRGRYETYALTRPVGAGASASICGPCSAYQSASRAHFSTSASASERIFPISVVITLLAGSCFSSASQRDVREAVLVDARVTFETIGSSSRLGRALLQFRRSYKKENVSICSPVEGLIVLKPDDCIVILYFIFCFS